MKLGTETTGSQFFILLKSSQYLLAYEWRVSLGSFFKPRRELISMMYSVLVTNQSMNAWHNKSNDLMDRYDSWLNHVKPRFMWLEGNTLQSRASWVNRDITSLYWMRYV